MTDSDRLERIEGKIDRLDTRLASLHIRMEHRITKLEGRASLFGILGGILVTVAALLLRQL